MRWYAVEGARKTLFVSDDITAYYALPASEFHQLIHKTLFWFQGSVDDGNEEQKRDLRSRGLSLVPLSCMSYVTGDGGGGIWPQPNYGGGGT